MLLIVGRRSRSRINVVGAPWPMKMGTIASPWRYDAAASHARAPLKHPIAYDLALRPRAAIFQCHGRLGWALIHPRNRVQVGCRRKPRGQISAPSRLLLTQSGLRRGRGGVGNPCSAYEGISTLRGTWAKTQLSRRAPCGLRQSFFRTPSKEKPARSATARDRKFLASQRISTRTRPRDQANLVSANTASVMKPCPTLFLAHQ